MSLANNTTSKNIFSYVKIKTLFFKFTHTNSYAKIRLNITTHNEIIIKIYINTKPFKITLL